MALIKCPECGTEVSDKALNCPKCAYPLQQSTSKENGSVKWKHVSWITYLSIGLLFFLPFCDINCSGRKLVSLTGVVLATGAQISPTQLQTEIGESHEIPANLWAILAFASVFLGLIVSLTSSKPNILSGLLGIACATFLIILQTTINKKINEFDIGFFSVSFLTSFWIVVIAAIGVGILNFVTVQYSDFLKNQTISQIIKTIMVIAVFALIAFNFDENSPFQFRPRLAPLFSFGPSVKELEEKRIADSIRVADSISMVHAELLRMSDSIDDEDRNN